MYSDWVIFLLGGVIVVWLLVLSFLVWRQSQFLKELFPKSGERDIRKRFEEVISETQRFKLEVGELRNKLAEFEKDGLGHIQRVKLVRYNPYDDTGGDQSFSISLLDKDGDGVLVTSLHSRAGTRVFAKPVINGRSGNYQFSKEEEAVVKKAML